VARLRAASPEGFVVESVERIGDGAPAISRLITHAEYAAWLPSAPAALRTDGLTVTRLQKRVRKTIDVARLLEEARIVDGEEAAALRAALDWPADGAVLRFRLRIDPNGGAKPSEVVTALVGGAPLEGTRYARIALDAAPVAAVPAAEGSVVSGHPDGGAVDRTDDVLVVAAAD
jgi:hypothetical protein